jgi:hypothetical protein
VLSVTRVCAMYGFIARIVVENVVINKAQSMALQYVKVGDAAELIDIASVSL